MTTPPPSAPPTSTPSGNERSFFRHVRNYLSATTVVGILQFVGIAIFTRILSPGEYGIYSVFLAAVGVLTILFELNLRGAVARYYLERTTDFSDFLRSTLFVLVSSSVIGGGLLFLFREPVAAFFAITPTVLAFAIVSAIGQVPWNIQWKLLVAQQKSGAYARLAMARGVLLLIVGAAAVVLVSHHLTGGISDPGEAVIGREYGIVGAATLVTLLFGLPLAFSLVRQSLGGELRVEHVRYGLLFGVPLIAHSMSNQILSFFDRIVVNQVESAREVGLYAFAYNLGMAMGAVVTAMNQAWLPLFMDLRREERFDEIRDLARKYSYAIAAVALVFVLFARELGLLLGDSRYHEALPLVPVVVFAYVMVFIYTIYANHSFYLRRTWVISLATVAAGLLNIGLNYWLVPIYGYVAAAWTTLASYIAMGLMHYCIARFVQRERVVPLCTFAVPTLVAALLTVAIQQAESAIPGGWMAFFALKLPLGALGGYAFWRWRKQSAKAAT